MASTAQSRKFYQRGPVKLLIAFIVLGIFALPLLLYIDRAIYDDPNWSPPEMQIRNQGKQLGEPLRDAFVPDDEFGFRLQPNLDLAVATYDFTFHQTTDDHGFPNVADWPDAADVVFLGDTLVMGTGVGVEHGFVSLVNDALGGRSVMNLSQPGAGLERQFRILRRYGNELSPGLIIACLYPASDLSGDTQFYAWLEEPLGMDYNSFRLSFARRQNGSPRKSLASRLSQRPLYLWMQSLVEPRLWGDRRIRHRLTLPDGSALLFNRDTVKFAKRRFSQDDAEVQRFFESLTRMQAFAAHLDATLAMVLIPSKEEIYSEDVTSRAQSAESIISQEIKRRGIPLLDLYPILRDSGKDRALFFQRDIHLNEDGNRLVARQLAQWIGSSLTSEFRPPAPIE
jgi:lysophospholipase L1-like esterase